MGRKIAAERRMVLLQLLIIIIITSLLILNNLSEAVTTIAKPGCQTHCGNLNIPFPFGMGSNDCFVNKWFEIICQHSTNPPTPFLKLINLVVLNISTDDATLEVKNPITFWNCSGKQTHKGLNLTGSPFVFSDDKNRFTAVSCGSLAIMNPNSENGVLGAACTSICSTDEIDVGKNGCNGVNCCHTSIPSNQIAANITFLSAKNSKREKECKYAFVVDEGWFKSKSTSFEDVHNREYVPVVLDWRLHYSFHRIFGPYVAKNMSCHEYSRTGVKVLQCHCQPGFQGNPYIPEGCQDVDECEDPKVCKGGTCVNLPGTYICSRPTQKLKVVLVGICSSFGALFLLVAAWGLQKLIKKRKETRRKQKFFKQNGGLLLKQRISTLQANVDQKTKLFNSKELEKATDHFNVDRIVGQGGQGTVYKGMLADGRIVAVKKSKMIDEGKISEFINEVFILSQINHRNIVKLLGCCLETEVPLLVYEFVPNGTLFQLIHDENEDFPLTWEMRLRIATEIAGALSYLHSAASFPIYHRDIKSKNILLDEKYKAKIADFGTSRSVGIDQTHLTTLVHGTFGYLDPEYFQSSQFTEKSDVYSFGVVLVELLTGQKPIAIMRSQEGEDQGRSLATYFIMCMEENRLFEIVDSRINKEDSKDEIIAVANLSKKCLNLIGRNRPTMKDVVAELENIQKSVKDCSTQQSSEEAAAYVRTEVTEPWDVISTSRSLLDSLSTSSSQQ